MGARNGGGRCVRFAETTLAIAAVFTTATAANADDVTVDDSRDAAISTSNADGNGPGNITIDSGGSVVVDDGVAITIDSSNTVTSDGSIGSASEAGGSGIHTLLTATDGATPVNLTSSITNAGSISVTGPSPDSALIDTDVFNAGIRLDGLGTFSGDITNGDGGSISVGGNASYGIQVGAPMTGSITNVGTISVGGDQSYGIMNTEPISGSILSTGTINARGADSTGIYVGGPVGGSVDIGDSETGGTISIGRRPTTDRDGNPIFQITGKGGLWIASDVNQGVLISGNGFTREFEIEDGEISTTSESTISANGGGTGIRVAPGGPGGFQNITIGPRTESPYSFVNRGNIAITSTLPRNTSPDRVNPYSNPLGVITTSADTLFVNLPGVDSTGVIIEGAVDNGTVYTTTLSGGFYNDGGNINVRATNANAAGIRIGNYGNVSTFNNRGDIAVTTDDTTINPALADPGDLGGDAYGVFVDATSALNSFVNSGHLTVTAEGQEHSAYGVVDLSGTVTNFTNSGAISASITQFNTTGSVVGVDLSANTTGVTFTNTGFIGAPVYLGSGVNTVTYSGATQDGALTFTGGTNALSFDNTTLTGDILLGGGASTMSVTNGSVLTGGIVSTGTADLNVSQSNITIADTTQINVTNASFDSGSTINFQLDGSGGTNGTIQTSGNVTIAGGATLYPVFTGVIQNPQTVNIVSAGSLDLGGSVASLVTPANSYMNTYTAQVDPANLNNLQITARRRTAEEMGLGINMGAVYEGSIAALALDKPVASVLAAQTTKGDFESAFRQLMPDSSDAFRQAALVNHNLALGAIRRRLEGLPMSGGAEGNDISSFWAQGLGMAGNASAGGNSDTQPGYSYWGLGFAAGADIPVTEGGKVGSSLSVTFTSVDLEQGFASGSHFLVYSALINVYGRQNFGRFYTQAIAGGGINNYDQRREIVIGSLRRTATGKSGGYQAGGTIEGGVRLEGGSLEITPFIRMGYLKVNQKGYDEKHGGFGVNLSQGSRDTSSLRGTVGLNVERDFELFYDSLLETDFRAAYTREFNNDPIVYTSQFTSGGTPFNLTSQPHGPNVYSFGFGVGHRDGFSSVTLDYDYEMSSHFTGHVATVTLRFRL